MDIGSLGSINWECTASSVGLILNEIILTSVVSKTTVVHGSVEQDGSNVTVPEGETSSIK